MHLFSIKITNKMKKLLLIVTILTLQFTAQAQDKIINFGVKGSMGMSDFSLSNSDISTQSRQSWEGGIMLRANLPVLPIYAQIEGLYTNAGSTLSYPSQASQELIINRVEVPIILGAKIGLGEISARAFGGIVAQQTVKDNLSDFGNDIELEKFGWGWQAGVGVDYKKFTVDLKYQKGANIVSNGGSIESNQYMLSVGYFIW
ncbi:hypothetical protein NH26_17525 [Flammeovirga pacifica]|uniref:Outer membrane protein beta-barrel domain-containing protein n=2 Tax=Flammeovirga pacifica TaxID=915059 RepID=A0A1S1Z3Z9_FLAPC|nr:hypothetical protein NH26_17525 [Flammeovirga pacifica]